MGVHRKKARISVIAHLFIIATNHHFCKRFDEKTWKIVDKISKTQPTVLQNTLQKKFLRKVLTKRKLRDIIFGSENYDPLAQSVEHLTFNQGVRDSSSRWVTKTERVSWDTLSVLMSCHGIESFNPQVNISFLLFPSGLMPSLLGGRASRWVTKKRME